MQGSFVLIIYSIDICPRLKEQPNYSLAIFPARSGMQY